MTKKTHIGPMMQLAATYVASNPGATAHAAAKVVGPNGSTRYGYQTVHRAIRAGLVHVIRSGQRMRLYPVARAA